MGADHRRYRQRHRGRQGQEHPDFRRFRHTWRRPENTVSRADRRPWADHVLSPRVAGPRPCPRGQGGTQRGVLHRPECGECDDSPSGIPLCRQWQRRRRRAGNGAPAARRSDPGRGDRRREVHAAALGLVRDAAGAGRPVPAVHTGPRVLGRDDVRAVARARHQPHADRLGRPALARGPHAHLRPWHGLLPRTVHVKHRLCAGLRVSIAGRAAGDAALPVRAADRRTRDAVRDDRDLDLRRQPVCGTRWNRGCERRLLDRGAAGRGRRRVLVGLCGRSDW